MTKDELTRVVRDYFEGWFDGDVERMERALHDDLVKRGPSLAVTSKERMLALTAQGEGRADGTDRRLDIRVEDVHGDIANVTVDSAVYREYVQLARTAEGWRIVNTLWRPA
jgi:ketosteroid isomerase-like protein